VEVTGIESCDLCKHYATLEADKLIAVVGGETASNLVTKN